MNAELKINPTRLANNSPNRMAKKARPFQKESKSQIKELGISVTNKCNLSCKGCGFNVPNQITPTLSNSLDEHLTSLAQIKAVGVFIEKAVIVGGEATLNNDLTAFLNELRKSETCNQIELVTNGLYPRGVTPEVLATIDSLVISDYICSPEFADLWRTYAIQNGYTGPIDFRRKDAWDDLKGELENRDESVQTHWNTCFYRSYDVTLERGRLFSCSRLAKKGWDDQGLLITPKLCITDIAHYLNSETPRLGCYSCATVNRPSLIPVAEQLNTNKEKIYSKAKAYLTKETSYDFK
ncbi:radical SAM protein [Reinekea marinisedimentorum]|uniref:4Fe-4S single cluster protein n=1 Tax=Reinekea marinisedimentorum TaxID=230495 RepID=A0A4R3IBW3_9GAMM|nr:radical SAM protein [Reinekea marinisedimentorum]TCS43105.1 4Fe-4S single cluster protein [Reinekea marinisedimentorum]